MSAFYLDEPVAEGQAVPLRRLGHDAVTTRAVGSKGQSDVQQLLYAARTGRILITYDLRDYPMLHEAWHELARAWDVGNRVLHPGILILPPTNRLPMADAAREIDALTGHEDVTNRLLIWQVPVGWTEDM